MPPFRSKNGMFHHPHLPPPSLDWKGPERPAQGLGERQQEAQGEQRDVEEEGVRAHTEPVPEEPLQVPRDGKEGIRLRVGLEGCWGVSGGARVGAGDRV